MKNIFVLILLLTSLQLCAQESEYTFENRGVNIFVDIDGAANKNFALGGPSFTLGYQLNPNLFLGVTASIKYGEIKREHNNDAAWRSPEGHNIWGYYVNEKGDTLPNPFDCLDDCGDMFFDLGNMDIQLNVRYNFLAHSRWTPYADLRIGTGVVEMTDGYDFTSNLLLGNRFALTHGDRALNLAVGYSLIHFTTRDLGMQGAFMFRFGMEF